MEKLGVIKNKISSEKELPFILAQLRLKNKRIVFTNGCFDILHLGHITYLSEAADCGDILIVGLNSDVSVKRLNKGANRPIQDQTSRAFVIAALHFVDLVIVFEEDTPYELVKLIQPDVLVKGADYKVEEVAGHDVVLAQKGEVRLIELVKGYSTSGIERKIREGK